MLYLGFFQELITLEVIVVTLYGMPPLPEKRDAPWWPAFEKALAHILKMTIAIIDSRGRLISLHNSLYLASNYQKHPQLMAAYKEFFSRVPQIYKDLSPEQTILDPLGLPVSLARLEDGSYLLLGGRLKEREPQHLAELLDRLNKLEVHERDQFWAQMNLITPEEMKENLSRAVALYTALYSYFSKPGLPALLSVVENLNGFIASTFDPERFDLEAILELAAAALVVLAGGGGAFAFSYEHPGRTLTLWCGEHADILRSLAEDWNVLGRIKEPVKTFDSLVRDRVTNEFAIAFEGVYRIRNGASVYLGLIGIEGGHLRRALYALANKVAIALGVSLLSTVFQYRWGMVFNSIRQGIVVIDNGGIILLMNQGAKDFFCGRRTNPAPGLPVTRCDFGQQIEEAVCSAAKNGCSFIQKRSAISEGDYLTHLRWDVVPLLHNDGYNVGAVLVFDDITAPVKLHEEIQDWERLATAGEIAAGLAHEIRNPLATAKAAIQLASMVDEPGRREELLGKMDHELDRMNNILTNFLNITKPKQGYKPEPVDLSQALRELLFLLNSEALLNEIDLEINFSSEKPLMVLGSPDSIKQVFLNIARNAIEAMAGGGKLTVTLSSSDNYAQITFQDNGPGISPENMAKLTKPFFTTKPGGNGLGLSISSSIVEMMGGKLNIKSSLGEGTTVDLVLPIYADLRG